MKLPKKKSVTHKFLFIFIAQKEEDKTQKKPSKNFRRMTINMNL